MIWLKKVIINSKYADRYPHVPWVNRSGHMVYHSFTV